MVRHVLVLGLAGMSMFTSNPGCGDRDDSASGVNAPCTRDKDCARELRCIEGVCTGPSGDSGRTEGGSKDAADDG